MSRLRMWALIFKAISCVLSVRLISRLASESRNPRNASLSRGGEVRRGRGSLLCCPDPIDLIRGGAHGIAAAHQLGHHPAVLCGELCEPAARRVRHHSAHQSELRKQ